MFFQEIFAESFVPFWLSLAKFAHDFRRIFWAVVAAAAGEGTGIHFHVRVFQKKLLDSRKH